MLKINPAFACFSIASFSLIGMPIFIGFYAKFAMITAVFSASPALLSWFILLVLFISTILSALTYLPVIYSGYFMDNMDSEMHGETPFLMLIPIVLTAIICVMFFFFGNNLISIMVR